MKSLRAILSLPLALAVGLWCVVSGLVWLWHHRHIDPRRNIFWDDTKSVCAVFTGWLLFLLAHT